MKLSEAIRLGAMIRPQAFGEYQVMGRSCALGAAMDALGIPVCDQSDFLDAELDQLFPTCALKAQCCPVRDCHRELDPPERFIGSVVIHLNDHHRWTREQIADWVETVEPAADDPRVTPSPSDAVREDVESSVLAIRET
jgi:hypothetical protein